MKYTLLLLLLLLISCRSYCPLIGVSYDDVWCKDDSIVRTWRVVDWCKYDNKGNGYFWYTEIVDSTATAMPEEVRKRIK